MHDPFGVRGDVEVIAHRGFSAEAPENTVIALVAGVEAGADAVEFDVHAAGDGTPVLLHDETLRRTTTGNGRVTDYTAEELGRLDAGSWFGSDFAGEPVPSLAAALQALPDPGVRIYAELKGVRDLDDVEAVAAIVRDARRLDTTVFISMTWELLDRVRVAEPEALVGYIVEKRKRAEAAVERAEGDRRAILDFDRRILLKEPALAERALERDVPLATWTVDATDEADALVRMGVPRLTTNRVRTLARWRDRRPPRASRAPSSGAE